MDCFFKRIIVMQIVVYNKRCIILLGKTRQLSGLQPTLLGEGGRCCRRECAGPGHPPGGQGSEPQCRGCCELPRLRGQRGSKHPAMVLGSRPRPVGKERGLGRVLPALGEKRTLWAQSLMLPLRKGSQQTRAVSAVQRLRASSAVLVEGHQGQHSVTLPGWCRGGVRARSKDLGPDAASTHTGPARVAGAAAALKRCIDLTALMLGGVFDLQ